jgi:hypothetical protein
MALAALMGACDAQTEVWQLTDFRVLGVRAYPVDEPARNAPRRGERAALELVSADVTTRNIRVAWLIVSSASFGAPTGTLDGGAPSSAGLRLPFMFLCDTSSFELDVPGLLVRCGARTEFTVPSDGGPDARGRESLTVFGMACAGGRIRVRVPGDDAGGPVNTGGVPFECVGSSSDPDGGVQARGWPFQYTLLVGSSTGGTGNDNLHPRIVGVRAGRKGETLEPVAEGAVPTIPRCADQSRNTLCPRLRVEVDFNEGARERYPELDPNTRMVVERDERLVTGFIVDRGRLSGGFRTDSAADPMSVMGNDLLPPPEPGDVRMIIYATDGRGGFDARELRLRVE